MIDLLVYAVSVLTAALILAAGSLVMTAWVRAVATPVQLERRPWSCNLCMSLLWTTPPLTVAAMGFSVAFYVLGGEPITGHLLGIVLLCGLPAWVAGAGIAWMILTALEHFERLSFRVGGSLFPKEDRLAMTKPGNIPPEVRKEMGLVDG